MVLRFLVKLCTVDVQFYYFLSTFSQKGFILERSWKNLTGDLEHLWYHLLSTHLYISWSVVSSIIHGLYCSNDRSQHLMNALDDVFLFWHEQNFSIPSKKFMIFENATIAQYSTRFESIQYCVAYLKELIK